MAVKVAFMQCSDMVKTLGSSTELLGLSPEPT
jgi:hypothetical protein